MRTLLRPALSLIVAWAALPSVADDAALAQTAPAPVPHSVAAPSGSAPAPAVPGSDPDAAIKTAAATLAEIQAKIKAANDEMIEKAAAADRARADAKATVASLERARQDLLTLETSLTSAKNQVTVTGAQAADLTAKLAMLKAEKQRIEDFLADIRNGNSLERAITVKADAAEVRPLAPRETPLVDKEERCIIQIELTPEGKAASRSFKELGISAIEMVDSQSNAMYDVSPVVLNLDNDRILIPREHFCGKHRRSLNNLSPLVLRIGYRTAKGEIHQTMYRLKYQRPSLQVDLGIGTYFAGGGFSDLEKKNALALFPALRLGGRWNLPLGDDNPDFYLQINGIFGGGFVMQSSPPPTQGDAPQRQMDRISLFAGFTGELGKFLEAGWAYDMRNKIHMFVFAPGRVLSASILTR